MGMFDTLYVDCRCGKRVAFQSKAGDCIIGEYQVEGCPPAIAGDLIGETEQCECGAKITLRGMVCLIPEHR
jgi:hypothetical protein